MTATDRLVLAAYEEYHVKQAWIQQGAEHIWDKIKTPLDIALPLIPGVGTAYSGVSALNNFRKGNIMSGVGDLAFAGAGLVPGGGLLRSGGKAYKSLRTATQAAQKAKGFGGTIAKGAPNVSQGYRGLQQARNVAGQKVYGRMGSVGKSILANPGTARSGMYGVGGGTILGNTILSPAQQNIEGSTSMPVETMLQTARQHIGNPLTAQPGQGGFAGGSFGL